MTVDPRELVAAFIDGQKTGLQWTEPHLPGGPYQDHTNPDSLEQHALWQAGFKSGSELQQRTSTPLMYESVEAFEEIVGYRVNEVFRDGWRMARTPAPNREQTKQPC